jgi:hypothetical protein
MKNSTYTATVFLLLVLCALPPDPAQAQLRLNGDPHFGIVRLEAGFEEDPKTVRVISGGRIDVSELDVCPDCTGFASPAPDVRLVWKGSDADLVIFFQADDSSHDATLIVNTPEAKWLGNDDAHDDTLNPMIRLSGYGEGVYDIWIGSFSAGERIRGVLKITEIDSERPD